MVKKNEDIQIAIDFLLEKGILQESGLLKLAALVKGLRAFAQATNPGAQAAISNAPHLDELGESAGDEEPEAEDQDIEELDAMEETEASAEPDEAEELTPTPRKRRGTKAKLSLSKEELAELYESMTAKDIAQRYGVSAATVNLRLRDYGIQKNGRGRRARVETSALEESEERDTAKAPELISGSKEEAQEDSLPVKEAALSDSEEIAVEAEPGAAPRGDSSTEAHSQENPSINPRVQAKPRKAKKEKPIKWRMGDWVQINVKGELKRGTITKILRKNQIAEVFFNDGTDGSFLFSELIPAQRTQPPSNQANQPASA